MIKHTDIPQQHFIYKLLPQNLKNYIQLLRLDRPVGVAFLLIPCLWGMALAGSFSNIMYFVVGAILMRSAGCVYNDIIDRDIDSKVERTNLRPLACRVISIRAAIILMLGIMLASFVILLQFNALTVGLGLFSVILVGCYPWMKRITYWPQLFLGLAFNWGALMGYTAVTGRIDFKVLLIYIYGILWTLFYDTLYAHQDKEDDAIIGVKSTALRLGGRTKPVLGLFILVQAVILLLINNYIGLVAVIVSAWILYTIDINDPKSCLKGFKLSQIPGWVMLVGLIV